MNKTIKAITATLVLGLGISVNASLVLANKTSSEVVSTNVPLTNYTYQYIEKLDGLGYIDSMRIGMKPYTRIQVAKWVVEAENSKKNKPAYIDKMIQQLKSEYKAEIKFLNGQGIESDIALKEWNLKLTHNDAEEIKRVASKSSYQPLNVNNNGHKYAEGLNLKAGLRVEKSLDSQFVFSLNPTFFYDEDNNGVAKLESGYVKTRLNNLEIALGKDELWWGQGKRGTLALSNNAKSVTYAKLSNIEAMKFKWFKGLGEVYASAFYSEIDDLKKFDGSILNSPGFVGTRIDFVPTDRFTFALSRTTITDDLNRHDLKNFFTGENADERGVDKWNSVAGIDFRWKLPDKSRAQVYGEIYGEDQSHELGFIPVPSKKAYVFGLYLPDVADDGRWSANLEYGKTGTPWYNHWVFTDGYVNSGNIIGDAMGNNAKRYYFELTRFMDERNQLSAHFERLDSAEVGAQVYKVNSFWISGRSKIENNLFLEYMAGLSKLDRNITDKNNYQVSLELKKYY